MDVGRSNFLEVLPKFEENLKLCDFICIDTEMSGLNTSCNSFPYDSVQERYIRIKKGAEDYLIIQYGICLFVWNDEKSRYQALPYNFYIFPRTVSQYKNEVQFLCLNSSLEFLAEHGFDFNKMIRDGLNYLLPGEQLVFDEDMNKKLQNSLTMKTNQATNVTPLKVPTNQEAFLHKVCKQLEEFSKDETSSVLLLDPCSPLQRRLVYEASRKNKYDESLCLESVFNDKNERCIQASKKTDENTDALLERIKHTSQRFQTMTKGFSLVLELIRNRKVPVVGHNMFTDLVMSVNQFHGSLPEKLVEFKATVLESFHEVYDTKSIGASDKLKSRIPCTTLMDLYNTVRTSPFCKQEIEIPEPFRNYMDPDESAKFHDAAYDAFATGVCFLGMAAFLDQTAPEGSNTRVLSRGKDLTDFKNKIHLMNLHEVPYLNIGGLDCQPSYRHVFVIAVPVFWETSHISELFSPYGYVHISWVDSRTAVVSLSCKSKFKDVKKNLVNTTGGQTYQVVPYKKFRLMNPSFSVANRPSGKRSHVKAFSTSSSAASTPSNSAKDSVFCLPAKRPKRGDAEDGEVSSSSDEGTDEELPGRVENSVKKSLNPSDQIKQGGFDVPNDW